MQARRADIAWRNGLECYRTGCSRRRLSAIAKTSRAMLQQDRACSSRCADDAICRFYLCARCRSQTLVCRRCDRGQIYCGRACALEVRRCRQREARARYQSTVRGREMHVQRNRQYRARQRSVTDQGVMTPQITAEPDASVSGGEAAARPAIVATPLFATSCHHCRKLASDFVRLNPIRRPLRRTIAKSTARTARRL